MCDGAVGEAEKDKGVFLILIHAFIEIVDADAVSSRKFDV